MANSNFISWPSNVVFVLCLFALLHFSKAVLTVGFAEDDVSVKENDGRVKIALTTQGVVSEPITIEIVPMSPAETHSNREAATPNVDFNATVQRMTLLPNRARGGDERMYVDIFDDTISELVEEFTVYLRVVNGSTAVVQLGRDRLTVIIRIDSADADRTLVNFNLPSLSLSEAVGVVNGTVYVEVQGSAELPLIVELTTYDSDDITFFSTQIVIPPFVSRVPVSFEIVDDQKYEGNEIVTIHLSTPSEYSQLYRLGYQRTLSLTIEDNDVARIAMETNTTTLIEGNATEVCVKLLEPAEITTYIDLVMIDSPNIQFTLGEVPAVLMQGQAVFSLHDSYLEHCITLWAIDDDVITPSWTLTFQLILNPAVYEYYPVANGSIVLMPNQVQLTVVDNDGIPKTPSDVKAQLINQGKDMLIVWKATQTPLQPVSQYVVEVEVQRRVARRQTSLHDDHVKRYITMDTEVVIQNIQRDIEYSIQVCAENAFGRTCVEPVKIKTGAFEGPRTGGILTNVEGDDDLPVWVYVVAALGLLVIVTVLLCLLASCISWQRSKRMGSYYPTKQESKTKKDKIVVQDSYRVVNTETAGTSSTDWELITNNRDFKLSFV